MTINGGVCTARVSIQEDVVIERFEEKGYHVICMERVKGHLRVKYICDQGHETEISWGNFNKGHRCGYCTNRIKKDISFVRAEFSKRGYTLLSTEYVDSRTKLKYLCCNGHESEIRWGEFQQGTGCIKCRDNGMRMSIDIVRQSFSSEGYVLLTDNYVNAHTPLDFKCPNGHVGTTDWDNFKQGRRCKQCHKDRMRGSTHPMWNPDLTYKDRVLRRISPLNKAWRRQVFERDNYICQICGATGRLQAHHIEPYSKNEKLRFDVSNGTTLCFFCHSNRSPVGFHRLYGTRNNTREQFEEFVEMRKKQLHI